MSKIGRKPIEFDKSVNIEIKGQDVNYKGPKASGVYTLPDFLKADLNDNKIVLSLKNNSEKFNFWGMHRALLSNVLSGAAKEFEKNLKITGLGYKAIIQGNKMQFALGYSHKIDLDIPSGLTVQVDKTGQKISVKSSDKKILGDFCSKIKEFRMPEPYKGTGIQYEKEVIRRKAGKAKSS